MRRASMFVRYETGKLPLPRVADDALRIAGRTLHRVRDTSSLALAMTKHGCLKIESETGLSHYPL